MAALILCGLWALTLAATDEPARVAARAQTASDSAVGMTRPTLAAAPATPPAAAASPAADLPPGESRGQ